MKFYIGQIFSGVYPPEAAVWCNKNHAYIEQSGVGEYIIRAVPAPTEEEKAEARLAESLAYLAETDWYAIRFAETGVAVPEEVKARRQAAREEIDAIRLTMTGLEEGAS